MGVSIFPNPFRPGAGHAPPYLAGRDVEKAEFLKLLSQRPILTNMVLTGLRGVGKTVLLATFKPLALQEGWLWAGTDLSESACVSEDHIATRILAGLAPLVSNVLVQEVEIRRLGFQAESERVPVYMTFGVLKQVFDRTPGLTVDKLKAVLDLVWSSLSHTKCKGIVLAYDEAQNLSDQAQRDQYPLSVLLDVFQSIQKKGIPILLVLTGLPTLFSKLVSARTFAERMFHVVMLGRLSESECRQAITVPMKEKKCPVKLTEAAIREIIRFSGGYPYFVQFLCRETFDAYLQQKAAGVQVPIITSEHVLPKLDSDFFAGRWNRVTDRQRELMTVIAMLPNCDEEFSVSDIVAKSKEVINHIKAFSASHVNQMLGTLAGCGLVYKNRHGKYSFAVPLLGDYIRRQTGA